MEKTADRPRVDQMKEEAWFSVPASSSARGVRGRVSPIGCRNHRAEKLMAEFDAVVLFGRSRTAGDCRFPGASSTACARDGVLPLQNKRVAGDKGVPDLWATDKARRGDRGGDTGSDCVGTSTDMRKIGDAVRNCSRSR